MKKSQMTLEAIVKMIPTILVILLLCSILVGFWSIFGKSKTKELNDFNRVIAEFEALKEEKIDKDACKLQPDVVPVPLIYEGYSLVFYSPSSQALPDICKGKACICINYDKKQHCTVYEDIVDYDPEKDKLGFEKPTTIIPIGEDKHYVKLKRECNKLSFI
ncbi:hypothetical protein DRJ22_04715 [Candidatus Woesearchaeota archaeon]|nr:MAG: hypothetical protein DRJ22_04715 [Candidatus Woesearchaeota archaeon]